MDITTLGLLVFIGAWALQHRYQSARVRLLSQHFGPFQIEQLMAQLHQAYFRALDETDAQRAAPIWAAQAGLEQKLSQQMTAFSHDFAQIYLAKTQVFKLALPLPYADQLFPRLCFDARLVFAVHAQGIARAVQSTTAPAQRARALLAELYLMQHTCHWFCRSLPTASARLLARHQTSYEQVLEAVHPQTRRDYLKLVARKPSQISG